MSSSTFSQCADSMYDFFRALNYQKELQGSRLEQNKDIITSAAGVAPYSDSCVERDVFIGCSPRAINKKLGPLCDISAKIVALTGREPPPNPTFHWAVIVGGYVHELSFDDHYYNFYQNSTYVVPSKYRLFKVGTTKMNDAAVAENALSAIKSMPERYELWTNNCQRFAIALLNRICDAGRIKVMTSFAMSACKASIDIPIPMRQPVLVPQDIPEEEAQALWAHADAEYKRQMEGYHEKYTAELQRRKEEDEAEDRKLEERRAKAMEADERNAAEADARRLDILTNAINIMNAETPLLEVADVTVVVDADAVDTQEAAAVIGNPAISEPAAEVMQSLEPVASAVQVQA